MVPGALLIESALTLGLSLLSFFVSLKIFMRYREERHLAQVFLALTLLFFFLSYITEFVVDLYDIYLELTGEPLYGDLLEELRQAVTWGAVALVPVFGVLFALEILQLRKKECVSDSGYFSFCRIYGSLLPFPSHLSGI
jgi:hypothetical protein